MKPGATGRFPQGKINPSDEGELVFKIGVTADGLVRIEFGKPVAWLAMSAREARELAQIILKNAYKAGPQ